MEPGAQFSGARQGVRYLANGGRGLGMSAAEPEQASLFGDRSSHGWHDSLRSIYPESVEYGHATSERPHDPTKWNGQMALPGMPKPTNPDLHRLRQANPRLNDLQFTTSRQKNHATDGRQGVPNTPRRIQVHDREGNRVGDLKLGYEQGTYDDHPGHREVDEIAVAPNHQGKGVAEAMYDMARMRGTKILHSSERSESGDSFAHRVGGPRLTRRRGQGQDDYLGLNPDPKSV